MSWFAKLTLMAASVGFYNCFRFVWAYRKRNWRRYEEGKYLMWTALVLGSLFGVIISNRLWPGWWGRESILMILYTCYAAFTGWLLQLMHEAVGRQQKEDEIRERSDKDEPTVDLRS